MAEWYLWCTWANAIHALAGTRGVVLSEEGGIRNRSLKTAKFASDHFGFSCERAWNSTLLEDKVQHTCYCP